jgi:hypothetical protein
MGYLGCKRRHACFFYTEHYFGVVAKPFEPLLGDPPDSSTHWPGTCLISLSAGCSFAKTLQLGELVP